MIFAGIDPAYRDTNGLAFWDGQKLYGLMSGSFADISSQILMMRPDVVVLEDSRLMHHVTHARVAYQTAKKRKKPITVCIDSAAVAARNVGRVDAVCQRWEDFCQENGFKLLKVSPTSQKRGVTTKVKAPAFKMMTGYEGRSNEHNRDAAMLVFKRK